MEWNPPEHPQLSRPPLLAATAALYLDFDGTLAEFAPRPDRVVIQNALPGLLMALYARLGGAVAVVSGRALADLDAYIAPAALPGAGLHGAELRPAAGGTSLIDRPDSVPPLLKRLRERFDADRRLVIEDKGAAIALHYRLAPERAEECVATMRALATAPDLKVIVGKRVVEARPRDADKGRAICALALHKPFAARPPVFVGDDVTDEDGFRAAAELGGCGVKVGAGATAARYRLADVGQVHVWLQASLRALMPGGGS